MAAMGDRHGWNRWENYKRAHEGHMRPFFSYWVKEDRVEITETPQLIYFEGAILCEGGVEIWVDKELSVREVGGDIEVRTQKYSYHVLHRSEDRVTDLFRYDNAHDRPGHPDRHHKHIYRSDGTSSVEHVGYNAWPVLRDVIEEAYRWWQAR